MYVLTIDIGNTTISAGLFADDACQAELRLPSNEIWEQAALTEALRQFLASQLPQARWLDGAVLTSVVPACTILVQNALESITGHPALELTAGIPCGINLGCYDVAHLGTDRIVDMAAAAALFDGPVAIWDLGTATTLSVIDRNRVFIGGMISPGVELGLQALHEHTAQLPVVTPGRCPSLLGNDTESNMRSGSVVATGLMISAAAARIAQQYFCEDLQVVITGGHAEYVLPWISWQNTAHIPDLQRRGMLSIWRMQARKNADDAYAAAVDRLAV